ncbi:MFS transporter [Nonomuraea mangrovi]|uniref:MFS transporter n=1 Tax=Nonomuraea mangrovi TaxID=2316207 RepID=A0ABW4SV78_9ACTN
MKVAWAALAATTVSFGLNFSAGVFFAPAAGAYGVSVTVLAVAAALSTALTGLAQPYVGTLLDRIGARWVLLLGLLLISAGYLALAVVQSGWQFVAAYTLLGGLGFAGSSSLTISTLIGRVYGKQAGPALTKAAVGINLGQLLTPWAATALFEPVGLRATYAILGVAGLAATLVIAVVLPADKPASRADGKESLRGRGRIVASFGLHAATMYVTVLILPKHATELDWSVTDAGRLVAVAAVAAGLTSAVLVRVLRGRAPDLPLKILHALRALSMLLIFVAGDPITLVAGAVIFGLSSFPVIPLTMAVLSRGLDPARLGRTLAPAWVAHQFAAATGLGVAAAIHALTDTYHAYFGLGLLLSLIALTLLEKETRVPGTARHR